MDYENKLALAKEALDSGSYDKETIEYIFPELAESEDEKVRKSLIETFSRPPGHNCVNVFNGIPHRKIVAWLEKQGEHSPILSNSLNTGKNTWTEEDEINLGKAIWYVENPAPMVAKNAMLVEWLKNFRGRVQPQPKQEWSEEDESLRRRCIGAIDMANLTDYTKDNLLNWLKSLKERYTWKPSDEQMDALRYVTNFDYGGHKATLVSLYEQLKKLK